MSIKSIALANCPLFLRPAFNRIANSPIGYRMASGVFWSMAGAVISRGMGLVAWVLVARILGKTGYGELGMIQSTVGMFGIFAGFATQWLVCGNPFDPQCLNLQIILDYNE